VWEFEIATKSERIHRKGRKRLVQAMMSIGGKPGNESVISQEGWLALA